MFEQYKQAKDYLNSFQNYELVSYFPYQNSIKLERMYLLLQHLKIPYQALRAIHIAGTKGKGSTAHFLVSLLATSGFKVGLFSSPHFFDFRERIQIMKKNLIEFKPDVAISAHIHEAGGIEEKIGKTKVINVAKKPKIFEI